MRLSRPRPCHRPSSTLLHSSSLPEECSQANNLGSHVCYLSPRSLLPVTLFSFHRWIGESSELLATASRDGTVKVWKVSSSQHQQQEGSGAVDSTNVLSLLWTFSPFDGIAVTSIDSTLRVRSVNGTVGWLLIVGAENGNMQIWMLSSTAAPPCHLHSISSNHIHGATVSKIKWKESCHSEDLKFASCGEDHSVRVFRCTL
jgi:hypothetical protein